MHPSSVQVLLTARLWLKVAQRARWGGGNLANMVSPGWVQTALLAAQTLLPGRIDWKPLLCSSWLFCRKPRGAGEGK